LSPAEWRLAAPNLSTAQRNLEMRSYFANPERAARLIRQGRSRFVLLYGVIGWGVPVAIGVAVNEAFSTGMPGFLRQLAIGLVVFPLGGILFGRWLWRRMVQMHGAAHSVPAG
jgi:hypothetical protein